ncbi:MAG: hypothetical protein IT580_09625 [Verrucomicrobiales bacterium]|nr:hypothetical protein [Verrucomicrobiales bacterium]
MIRSFINARPIRSAAGVLATLGVLLLAGLTLSPTVMAAEGNGRNPMELSVVTLEITAKEYDYFQPWNKPTRSIRKHALVNAGRELVTTAQNLADRTLVRAQKGGRGRWFNAEVKWLDYHANLAVVTVADEGFWTGLQPAPVSEVMPRLAEYEIIRWRDGNLETRRADFSKFTVGDGALSFAPRIQLELNTEISGLGWAEPVTAGGKVLGISVSKGGNVCLVAPWAFIQRILEARRQGKDSALGYFDFVWQQSLNPATLQHLKLEGDPRGAVLIDVPKTAGTDYALKKHDIILEVDGFAVDSDGDIEDPEFGHVMMEGLATRRHFAGDRIPMKILRDGKPLEIQYLLPQAKYSVDLLPMHSFDEEPEYLVAGGFLFQPLTQSYLRGWGDDWRRRAPFRLSYYAGESPTPERPALVILTQVLPDPINIGYQDIRSLVVEKINGRVVRFLADVEEALKAPKDGVHVVEFFRGDNLQRVLLDATQLEAATSRVLKRYGIPAASVIRPPRAAAAKS